MLRVGSSVSEPYQMTSSSETLQLYVKMGTLSSDVPASVCIDGEGDECDNDDDGDGINDATDNCLLLANTSQADR